MGITFTNQEFMMWTGQAFLYLLAAVLFISPILSIKWKPLQRRRIWLIKLRRYLGIGSGLIALSHFVFYLWAYTASLQHLVNSLLTWWGITGLIAVLSVSALTVTSNDYSVRKLKKKWKRLHYLTYALPALVVMHALLALKNWPLDLFVPWIILFVILLMLRMRSLNWLSYLVIGALALSWIFSTISGGGSQIDKTPINPDLPRLSSIDTSHPDYYEIWWETAKRRNFLPGITYSDRAIKWCAETGAHPISIGEKPLYCSDGRSGTWKNQE